MNHSLILFVEHLAAILYILSVLVLVDCALGDSCGTSD